MGIERNSIIITCFVVLVLVLASPQTQAVSLGIVDLPGSIMLGKSAEFKMFVDVENGERVPIKYVILEFVKDGEEVECVFNPDGSKYNEVDEHFNNCKGVKLKRIDVPDQSKGPLHGLDHLDNIDYTFGYGYGRGLDDRAKLHYKVKIDTKKPFISRKGFRTGIYNVTLKAYAARKKDHVVYNHTYSSLPKTFNVTYPCERIRVDKKWCSIDEFSTETLSAIADADKTHNCVLSKKEAKELEIAGCTDGKNGKNGEDDEDDEHEDDDEDEEDDEDDEEDDE